MSTGSNQQASPKIDDLPNPWSVMEEFLKTIVTLGSGLLGLTVTFASQLIGKADVTTKYVLYAAWGLSLVAVMCAVLAHAGVIRYLRGGTTSFPARLANIAYSSLFLAAVAFAVFGGMVINRPELDVEKLVAKATADVISSSKIKSGTWKVVSVKLDSKNGSYDFVMEESGSKSQHTLSLTTTGDLIEYKGP